LLQLPAKFYGNLLTIFKVIAKNSFDLLFVDMVYMVYTHSSTVKQIRLRPGLRSRPLVGLVAPHFTLLDYYDISASSAPHLSTLPLRRSQFSYFTKRPLACGGLLLHFVLNVAYIMWRYFWDLDSMFAT